MNFNIPLSSYSSYIPGVLLCPSIWGADLNRKCELRLSRGVAIGKEILFWHIWKKALAGPAQHFIKNTGHSSPSRSPVCLPANSDLLSKSLLVFQHTFPLTHPLHCNIKFNDPHGLCFFLPHIPLILKSCLKSIDEILITLIAKKEKVTKSHFIKGSTINYFCK